MTLKSNAKFQKQVKILLACVSVVASAITNGTFTMRASDLASSVFPILMVKVKLNESDTNPCKQHIHTAIMTTGIVHTACNNQIK